MHTYYQTYKKALKPPVKTQPKMRLIPGRDTRALASRVPSNFVPKPAAKKP